MPPEPTLFEPRVPEPSVSVSRSDVVTPPSPEMRAGGQEPEGTGYRRSKNEGAKSDGAEQKRRAGGGAVLRGLGAGLIGLAGLSGLGASLWVHHQTQREILALATELAQVRLSLDLYAHRDAAAEKQMAPPPTETEIEAEAAAAEATAEAAREIEAKLSALAARLDVVEEKWRVREAAAPAPVAIEEVAAPQEETSPEQETSPQARTGPAARADDCLPAGMRLLVATGDSYPICGTGGVVTVSAVGDGYIVLDDGSTIASGGSLPLAGTACLIGVTSDGDEGLTGYAEIRVSC